MLLLKATKMQDFERGMSEVAKTIVEVLPEPAAASTMREEVPEVISSKMTSCSGE